MSLSRRAVLLAAASGVLSACGSPSSGARPAAAAPPSPTPSTAGPASPSAVPSSLPVPLTRAQVVAKYAGAVPTEWGTDVTGVTRRLATTEPVVALTFDACGGSGSGYDHALIATLRRHRVPATLFLNARWIAANPAIAADLAGDPLFELANHGTAHRPLSVTGRSAYGIAGTRDPGEAYDEVAGNVAGLHELTGTAPGWFRTGTAHYDEVATRIVADLGQRVAGFDVNADAGATRTAEQVAGAVRAATAGSIVLAHMNRPAGGTAKGFAAALPELVARLRCVRLSDPVGGR